MELIIFSLNGIAMSHQFSSLEILKPSSTSPPLSPPTSNLLPILLFFHLYCTLDPCFPFCRLFTSSTSPRFMTSSDFIAVSKSQIFSLTSIWYTHNCEVRLSKIRASIYHSLFKNCGQVPLVKSLMSELPVGYSQPCKIWVSFCCLLSSLRIILIFMDYGKHAFYFPFCFNDIFSVRHALPTITNIDHFLRPSSTLFQCLEISSTPMIGINLSHLGTQIALASHSWYCFLLDVSTEEFRRNGAF